jgi:hypothetical protein
MIEIRIQLDAINGLPTAAIKVLEINAATGNRTAYHNWEQDIKAYAAQHHPHLNHLFDPRAVDTSAQKLRDLTRPYISDAEMAIICRGGDRSLELRTEILAKIPLDVQSQLFALLAATESVSGVVENPIDLMKAFLLEVEAQVQPLYEQALSLLSAKALEDKK